jgi:hypothetical protein
MSRRFDGKPETAKDSKFFDLRESGYTGPIDQDGNPIDQGGNVAFANVALLVTEGSPSIYVPAVFDAAENSQVMKPHTTWDGAWAAAEAACDQDKSLYRFEVWEMEVVIDAPKEAAETCPAGCGCKLGTDDADRNECGCDGPCTKLLRTRRGPEGGTPPGRCTSPNRKERTDDCRP